MVTALLLAYDLRDNDYICGILLQHLPTLRRLSRADADGTPVPDPFIQRILVAWMDAVLGKTPNPSE